MLRVLVSSANQFEEPIFSAECQISLNILLTCSLFHSTASDSGTFMEVVKKVARQGSAARDSVAIRADQQSYSYIQLISSALKISNLLSSSVLKTVRNSCSLIP